jgi:hypothetical protein
VERGVWHLLGEAEENRENTSVRIGYNMIKSYMVPLK